MRNKKQSHGLKPSSTSQHFTEGSYLDAHYEAMKAEYENLICSVSLKKGWHVLDAGCGGGSYLPILVELLGKAGRIAAIDIAEENIAVVNSRVEAGEFDCAVEAKLASVTSLPYDDNSFDAIWCANVVQYLDDKAFKICLDECYRVLKPGGLLAIKEVNLSKSHFYPFGKAYMLELFHTLNPLDTQVHGCLRTPDHAIWLKEVGFVHIRSSTLLSELHSPLDSAAWTYVSAVLPFWLNQAMRVALPDPALSEWASLGDFRDVSPILNQPAFFWREYHGLVVGQVPLK